MTQAMALAVPEDHPCRSATASIVLGRELAGLDRHADGRARKMRALTCRLCQLRRTSGGAAVPADLSAVTVQPGLAPEPAATLAVDLAFDDPFAPYQLHFSERAFVEALRRARAAIGLDAALVEQVLRLKGEALGAHARLFGSRWKLAMAGVSSAALFPFFPAFAGAAAGALVTARGLAVLGGHGLAVRGLQIAGGSWLVAGAKSAASSSARAGARRIVSTAPAAAIRVEVAKCQTWLILGMGRGLWSREDVAARVEKLAELEKDVSADLVEARSLNDPGAERVRDLEAKLRAITAGREWIARKVRDTGEATRGRRGR
jgi:hypothetical protein